MPPAGEPPMSAGFPDSMMGGPMQEVAPIAASGATSATVSAAPRPAMAGVAADALLEPWFSCLQERTGALLLCDCHTHLGCADPDGSCFEREELLGALQAVDARAVVFPLAEPGSYRAANDRMLAAAEAVRDPVAGEEQPESDEK